MVLGFGQFAFSGPAMIRYNCPQCKTLLQSADNQAGATVACPKCKAQMRVPAIVSSSDGSSWFVLDLFSPHMQAPAPRFFVRNRSPVSQRHDSLHLPSMQDAAPISRQASGRHCRLSQVQSTDAGAYAGFSAGWVFVVRPRPGSFAGPSVAGSALPIMLPE